MPAGISLKNELIRKSIHISTVIIPIIYYYHLDREQKESRKFLWSIFLWGVIVTFFAGMTELLLEYIHI